MRIRALAHSLFLAVLACGLSGIFSPSDAFAENAKAKILGMTGQVQYRNPGTSEWQTAAQGMELEEGAGLFVGPDSDCQVAFGEDFKTVTQIKQDSRIILRSIKTDPQLDVTTGEVFALVRNLKAHSTFKVSTPTAVASVRGTAFSFAAEGIGAQAGSTLQVFEHTVGLNPIGKPEDEKPIVEGHGAVMGADGRIEKEFELSPEAMQTGHEFMGQAQDMLGAVSPEKENAPASDQDQKEEKDSDDQNKKDGGPNPPAPPANGPPGGPGQGGPGPDGSGPNKDAGVDSAVDGVVMDMAHDSELSKSETFGTSAMNQMFEHLADMNGAGPGPAGVPGAMDPGQYADMVKNAIAQTDYFQNMPPDVQGRLMETIDAHADTAGPMAGAPPGGVYFDGQIHFAPDGSGAFDAKGPEPFGGATMDPSLMHMPPDTFFEPNTLASFINDHPNIPPPELQSIINFMFAIRQDYNNYVSSNGGSDAGYYGSQRTITNFNFVKDNVSLTGSVHFTPVDADPSPATGLHDHDGPGTGPNFIHATNVVVKDDPSGASGNVVVAPPGTVEVPTS